jgi:dsDNA-specific endonuclease/ATPase MutS2
MSEQPPVDQKQVQEYIDHGMKMLNENPASLEPHEKRLFTKLSKFSQTTQQAMKDAQDLKNQIEQAQARLRSVELQAENSQGSVNAYVDELVAAKFGIEDPSQVAPPPQVAPTPPKGNGAPVNRKQKRTARSKKKANTKSEGSAAAAN